jgi:hypothetical protein
MTINRACRRHTTGFDLLDRRNDLGGPKPHGRIASSDVAPNFYPVAIGVWRSIMTCWAVVAAVRGAEPSAERGVADRLAVT